MQIINDLELDFILKDLCNCKHYYYKSTSDYFQDLYKTGCRSTEPLQIDRWILRGDYYDLFTLKTKAIRSIKVSDLSDSFNSAFIGNKKPYDGLTYNQLTLELRKNILVHPIYCGNKIADTYLFRYNKAKQLFNSTQSVKAVQDIMKWESMSIAHSYITQELYTCRSH